MPSPSKAADSQERDFMCQAKARNAQAQPVVAPTECVRVRCDSQAICGRRNTPTMPAAATALRIPSSRAPA